MVVKVEVINKKNDHVINNTAQIMNEDLSKYLDFELRQQKMFAFMNLCNFLSQKDKMFLLKANILI